MPRSDYLIRSTEHFMCFFRHTYHFMCFVRRTDHFVCFIRRTDHFICFFRRMDHFICFFRHKDVAVRSQGGALVARNARPPMKAGLGAQPVPVRG